jgi:uncharacterized peroxidase-related enzyme
VAHIELGTSSPGIRGLFEFRPETAAPLGLLAETLLRGDNSLTRGERELIAAYVSGLNECRFCADSHSAFAALQLPEGWDVVDGVLRDPASAPVGDKLRSLLAIAAQVQRGGLHVTAESVAAAREAGATDVEIHDAVLIAAAFCMFNRYVDGLDAWTPDDAEGYRERARFVAEHGYGPPLPPALAAPRNA